MIKKIFSVMLVLVISLSAFATGAAAAKKGISLSRSSASVTAGRSFTIKTTVTGLKKYTVQYSSSDKSVAKVKAGKKSCTVTALKAGEAVITAKIKGTKYKASCRVKVKEKKQEATAKEADSAAEASADTITVDGKTYTLSFEDNFDGRDLDLKKWSRCPEWKRQDLNNYWDDDMSYLDGNGCLVIETSYDSANDRYLSGAVRTKDKFEQAFGYYEIRCTVNTIPGYWTAFWLMGSTVGPNPDGGRSGTEIDIMESAYQKTGKVQNTLNWGGYAEQHKSSGNVFDADVYDGKFHTFSLLWTDKEYVFYTDGKETWRTDAKEALGTCQVPLYMKISAETGSWTGLPDKKLLPDKMLVDYVRVYK